jgi:hypothetical protein
MERKKENILSFFSATSKTELSLHPSEMRESESYPAPPHMGDWGQAFKVNLRLSDTPNVKINIIRYLQGLVHLAAQPLVSLV